MKNNSLSVNLLSLCLVLVTFALFNAISINANVSRMLQRPNYNYRTMMKRSAKDQVDDHHKTMMHNHLSRKVFDRACAASKDSIDEIVACVTTNEHLMKTVDAKAASNCYRDAFGQDFDPKDLSKHKELICKNREKFESMTACVYRETAAAMDQKELEKLTEAMVDVGLCIINALDG